MVRKIVLILSLFLMSGSLFAAAPDVRLSDNAGNVVNVNATGGIPVVSDASSTTVLTHVATDRRICDCEGDCATVSASGSLMTSTTNDSGSIYYIDGVDWATVNTVIDVTDVNRHYTDETVGDPVVTAGTGKNDVHSYISSTSTGFSSYSDAVYTIEIVSEGTPDVWRWKKDSGAWSSNINMAVGYYYAPTNLSDNVAAYWNSTTGHTAGDTWTITATAKFSIGGTLRSMSSKATMVRGSYYFDAANDKLYVWAFDNRDPGDTEIFIGKSRYQYRGMVTTINSSPSFITFQDLELRFSNDSGLTIVSPNSSANRLFSHHHSGNGFGTINNTGNSTNGNNFTATDCWTSFCAFGTGIGSGGTSQPFTFEGSNNWAIRCIASWGYKAGFDFLSYNAQTVASGGLINCFSIIFSFFFF